jgi:EAL domain-containing protein (putative c-di-GMP-specific phosphodiesterase class I)
VTGLGRDEFHRLRTGYMRLRSALRDRTTGLFSFPLHFDDIRALLAERARIGVLWVGLGDRRMVETVYGWEAYDHLLSEAAQFLEGAKGVHLPPGTIVAIAGVHADAFTIFVPSDHAGRELDNAALALLGLEIEASMDDYLAGTAVGGSPSGSGVRVGAALLADNPFHRFERRIYVALDEARGLAERPRDAEQLAWLAELQRVLRERDVETVFQPIVDLESGDVCAVEAYTRGPVGSVFRLPRVMFSVGQDAGLGVELDRMCHEKALLTLEGESWSAPDLLFLNTTAENLIDAAWTGVRRFEQLERAGLTPDRIALEVPEAQLAAEPEAYRAALQPLRDAGYRLSLDDIGSGTRSVALVEVLRPDFLKFDLTLVRGLGGSQMRRELVRSLVQLADRTGARLVAERVETDAERLALIECGARWGQGYFFAGEAPGSSGRAAARGTTP